MEEPIHFSYTQTPPQLVRNRKLSNYVSKPTFLKRQATSYLEISRLPRLSGCNSSSFALQCHTSRFYVSGTPVQVVDIQESGTARPPLACTNVNTAPYVRSDDPIYECVDVGECMQQLE